MFKNQVIFKSDSLICATGCTINGNNNIIFGDGNNIKGWGNWIKGDKNLVKCTKSKVFGNFNMTKGNVNKIKGDNNFINGDNNFINGNNNSIEGDKNEVICKYSTIKGYDRLSLNENIFYKNMMATVIGKDEKGFYLKDNYSDLNHIIIIPKYTSKCVNEHTILNKNLLIQILCINCGLNLYKLIGKII